MKFTEYLFQSSKKIWDEYLNHPFVNEMGKGTLDKEKFKEYLIQDYLYLIEYTKAYCMAAVKSTTVEQINMFLSGVDGILKDEGAEHIVYLKGFNENISDLQKYSLNKVNESYTSYMKGIALTSGIKEIVASILPCTWGYNYIGKYLRETYKDNLENNFYKFWIDSYAGEGYTKLTEDWINFTDEICANISAEEKEKLKEIFVKASEYELDFWNMAYDGKVK